MSGLFGTTAGPWAINYDKTSIAIPHRGPHCVTSTYCGTSTNARAIAQLPAMLELVAAVADWRDAEDLRDMARAIVRELEVK